MKKKTIQEFFKNAENRLDDDLQRAIELSKQEHIKEQKKLLEACSSTQKRSRLIRPIVQEDQDDWFQTVSNRKVKKEKITTEENQIVLDIEDVSDWLKVKEEEEEKEQIEDDRLSIEDLTTFLKETSPEDLIELVSSDNESNCSVIDLVNPDSNDKVLIEEEEESDDGYLSPLEGFVNINENKSEYNNYFDQLQLKAPKKRKSNKTTTKKRKPSKRTWFKRKKYCK